jgi:hypothetical protein
MLAAAASRGFDVSARLITDWVDKGLLDRPRVRGLGRGKGTSATWPDEQLELFLQLLVKRHDGARRAATLSNLPVMLWLVFGDDYASLRQIRRALTTWTDAYATVKHGRAERTSLALLAQVAHPDARESDKLDFELLITNAAKTGALDLNALEVVGAKVIDPKRTGIARGPFGMLDTDTLIRTLDFRITGLANVQAPDAVYEQARQLYRGTRATEARVRDPQAAHAALTNPAVANRTTLASLGVALNEACLDLVTLIGMTIRTPPNTSQASKT